MIYLNYKGKYKSKNVRLFGENLSTSVKNSINYNFASFLFKNLQIIIIIILIL